MPRLITEVESVCGSGTLLGGVSSLRLRAQREVMKAEELSKRINIARNSLARYVPWDFWS
jgi:hypothetical protein